MRHLSAVEFKTENSINPFYMENWKLKTLTHLAQFSQEFNIKLPEIGHQNVINHITLNILKLSATKIKVLQDWMKHHGFANILHVLSNFYPDPNSIGFNNSYQDEENKLGTLPRLPVHSLKFLCFWDREWVSCNHFPTPSIGWTFITSEDFQHWYVMTPYLCEVLTYTCNVPTMHHHQEPSSGKTPQEDSTPSVNEQDFVSSIPDNHCRETFQHMAEPYHLSYPTSTTDCLDESILSCFCRIPIELTKNPLHHAGQNGEHSNGENLHNGGENGEHSGGEDFHGDNLNPSEPTLFCWS